MNLTCQFVEDAGLTVDDKTVKSYFRKIWKNPRYKGERSFCLTKFGFKFVEKEAKLKFYQIDLPHLHTFTNQEILWLDQFIDCPYYLTETSIYVSREKVAVQLILHGGDVQKFLKSKADSQKNSLTFA